MMGEDVSAILLLAALLLTVVALGVLFSKF